MRVGHGVAPIEVRHGEALGGYGARTTGVEDVLDPLEAHAISFSGDDRRFLLIVLDVVSVNTDLAESIRRAVRADGADVVWVSATHTHSAPDTGCLPGGGPTPASVAARLLSAARSAARDAMAAEAAADLRTQRAWCRDAGAPRNVEVRSVEPLPIDVLAVMRAGSGERMGTLVVTPVHPTVLPSENLRASADLSGAIRRAVARTTDAGWVVAATGGAGDISTRATRRARDLAEADRIGDRIAAAVRDADDVGIDAETDAPRTAIAAAAVDAVLEPNVHWSEGRSIVASDDPAATRRETVLEEGLRLIEELGGHGTAPVRIPVESVRIGSASLVGIPGEPFLAVAERIRTSAAHAPIVLGYANGYVGYLPDAGSPRSYETVVSPVDPGSIDELVEAARSSVARMWRREG